MNIVLIKAGGIGTRMGASIPKQFVPINEKPVIIYTLEQFENNSTIDEIIVVCTEGWQETLWDYARQYHISKLKKVVIGGETSLKSIKNGLDVIGRMYSPEDIVLIHDANRPLVSQDIITSVVKQCSEFDSAVATIPCTDEIVFSNEHGTESDTFLDRKKVFRVQTPDAYKVYVLKKIFEDATEQQLLELGATINLYINQGNSIHFAKGSELNIRLTTQEDLLKCEALLLLEDRIPTVG